MRILEVSPYDLGVVGGVQGQVLGLSEALRRAGCDVKIVAPGADPRVGISLGRSFKVPANGSVAPVAIAPDTRRFRRALDWADVVHVHEPLTPMAGIAVLRALSGTNLLERVWVTFHRDGVSDGYRRWASWWSYLLPARSQWIAVSPFAARTVAVVLGTTPLQIPNGIDIGPQLGVMTSGPSTHGRTAPRILFVGRHEERKGLEVLLRAVGGLDLDCELAIVGAGPLTEALRRRYIDPRIHWLGVLDKAELEANYREAELVVAPSLYGESFGVVILEAMVNGAVVVASDLPAYRWLSQDGRGAALFPPGDSVVLAALLRSLLTDNDMRRSLRDRGHEIVAEFAFTTIADRYRSLFAKE